MRNKFMVMLFCAASLLTCVSTRLDAISMNNSQMVIAITSGGTNGFALSTHTLSVSRDIEISVGGAADEQFVGFIEINCTKADATAAILRLKSPRDQGAATGETWAAILGGATAGDLVEDTDIANPPFIGVKIYSDVVVTSTTEFTKQAYTAVTHTAHSADLVNSSTSTYAGQLLTLSFWLVDHASTSFTDGTYFLYLNITYS